MLIFLVLALTQYLLDYQKDKCKSWVLLIHHFFDIYLYFPFLFGMPGLHLVFALLTLNHWIANNKRCQMTVVANKECNRPESEPFNDFLSKLFGGGWHHTYIICVIVFDLLRLSF